MSWICRFALKAIVVVCGTVLFSVRKPLVVVCLDLPAHPGNPRCWETNPRRLRCGVWWLACNRLLVGAAGRFVRGELTEHLCIVDASVSELAWAAGLPLQWRHLSIGRSLDSRVTTQQSCSTVGFSEGRPSIRQIQDPSYNVDLWLINGWQISWILGLP